MHSYKILKPVYKKSLRPNNLIQVKSCIKLLIEIGSKMIMKWKKVLVNQTQKVGFLGRGKIELNSLNL